MQPAVSVIIPCYNCERHLASALDSVLGQTFRDIECLLVDDGSTDATATLAREAAARDPRVRYLAKDHAGVAAARNFGIEHARGEWIQFLDSDDLLDPAKLAYQMAQVRRLPPHDEMVLYTDYQVRWEDDDGKVTRIETRIVGEKPSPALLAEILQWSFEPNIPVHSNSALFRRQVFRTTRYNERRWAFEDLELFVTLLVRGVPFVYSPINGMCYRVHTSNMTRDRTRLIEAYADYLQAVHDLAPGLLRHCTTLADLLGRAIRARERRSFVRLRRLASETGAPVRMLGGRVDAGSAPLLELAYWGSALWPYLSSKKPYRRLRRRLQGLRPSGGRLRAADRN